MRAARRAELGLDEPLPPARAFRLHAVAPATERTNRSFRELDVDGSDWTVHWIAVGPEAARCSASLIGEEAEGLTQALDQISEAFDGDPDLCAEATGPDPVRVDFRGDRSWTLDLTGKCMIEHEPVKDLSKRLFRLPIDAVSRGEASCD